MMKPSVYVVDDDADFRSYLSTMLAAGGYEVVGIETGNDLLRRLTPPDMPSVILLDVLLPDSDGIEIMAKIKQAGIAVPVIMLSGAGQVRTVVEAMKLGARDFLTKPFDDGALEDAIQNVLEAASQSEKPVQLAAVGDQSSGLVTANPKMQRLPKSSGVWRTRMCPS